MNSASVRVVAGLLALACVASAGVAAVGAPAGGSAVVAPPGTAGTATHSFVQFNVSEARTDPGGTVAARVTFHNAYGTIIAVTGPDGFRYEAKLAPVGGVQTVVRVDTAAAGRGEAGAVAAVDGELANASVTGAPGGPLPEETYNVTLYAGGQVRDAMALRIGDDDGTPPAAMAARLTPTPTTGGDSAPAGDTTAAAPGFGVVVALASLAVATALLGTARRRR